jgi:REP element-mobilizing transposase RayT
MLKGNLSRLLSTEFPDLLTRHRTKSPWAEGYFARSSGKADLEATRRYIEDQAVHHGYRGEWTSALTYSNPSFQSPAFQFAQCVCILSYHLILVTKFRTAMFDEGIAPGLFEYIVAVGRKRGFAIDTMSLMPDHIHLVMEGRPDVSIAECALSIVNNTHHASRITHHPRFIHQTTR